jgi:hypothetical protein
MGLTNILPERARQVVYAVYAFIGVGFGATLAGYAAVPEAEVPMWLVVAMAVYGFVGTALGLTAAANVTPTGDAADTRDMLPMETHTYYGVGRAVEPESGGASPRAPGDTAEDAGPYARGGFLPPTLGGRPYRPGSDL